uniref:Uncharacterized protein n=1 Tax=Arundo donax TaxID=35708 RepID=A0A0A9AMZ1_ARUDO
MLLTYNFCVFVCVWIFLVPMKLLQHVL